MPYVWRPNRFRILPVARDFTASGSNVNFTGFRAVTNVTPNDGGDWTIMAWAMTTTADQQTPAAQMGNSGSVMECAMYLDGSRISILTALPPGYHFSGSGPTYQTNRWECFLAGGTSNGWASYTRSADTYYFVSTGNQRVTPGGTGLTVIGPQPSDPSKRWRGPIGMVAIWGAFLNETEAKALGHGVAPWNVRRSKLRFLWAPRTQAGPDLDLIGRRVGTQSGSPTLAAFPARGLIRP